MSTVIDALASRTSGAGSSTQTANEAGSADRFLKLLVAQMENQDPLNPLDNAQITSQMAQINTVNGIEKLNVTVEGLNRQFLQLQALQGASLVGRQVTLQGDRVAIDSTNGATTGVGGFELASGADRVKVEILNGAGRVIDTLELGAQGAGRHGFEWDASRLPTGENLQNLRFRITPTSGTAAVGHVALMRDRVESVSLLGDRLVLETGSSGSVDYGAIKAVN